jgi:NAD-dependent SIR2 family protein deacetylase
MSSRQNIVYFLGAGCSVNFGYPLTGKIMADILLRLRSGNLFNTLNGLLRNAGDEAMEKDLLGYIELVYPGLAGIDPQKEGARLPNITEVFSFVDHLCFYNTPHHPQMDETKLTRFRVLLNRALAELLQQYEYSAEQEKTIAFRQQFINSIKQQYLDSNITIITTNYDMVIDWAFVDEALKNQVDYGVPYREVNNSTIIQPPAADDLRLKYYKLHGSINWLTCSLCGYYYINPGGSIVHQEFRDETDVNNTCICNNNMRLKSVLVAPSIVRDIRDSNLLQIWKGALEAIRTADKIIMIGYSMPAEDLAIKSIILRGLNGRHYGKPPRLEVVQYGDTAKPNYQNIFGSVFNEDEYEAAGLEAYLKRKNPELFTV